jgi:nucleoside-diphosphate-sugar epimerase
MIQEALQAYSGRRVFVTGHTGFKGAWLCAWLHKLGAHMTGYALPPESRSLFLEARIARGHEDFFLVVAGAGDDPAKWIGQERVAPEFQAARR